MRHPDQGEQIAPIQGWKGIKAASGILVLVCPAALHSKWVGKELTFALDGTGLHPCEQPANPGVREGASDC